MPRVCGCRCKCDRLLEGKWTGGAAPFGYAVTRDGSLVPRPGEAETLRGIFAAYLRVRSLARLGVELLDNGVEPRRAAKWSVPALAHMLKSRVYLGKIPFRGTTRRGAHAPLIAPVVFNKVQQLLALNNKRRSVEGGTHG